MKLEPLDGRSVRDSGAQHAWHFRSCSWGERDGRASQTAGRPTACRQVRDWMSSSSNRWIGLESN